MYKEWCRKCDYNIIENDIQMKMYVYIEKSLFMSQCAQESYVKDGNEQK